MISKSDIVEAIRVQRERLRKFQNQARALRFLEFQRTKNLLLQETR